MKITRNIGEGRLNNGLKRTLLVNGYAVNSHITAEFLILTILFNAQNILIRNFFRCLNMTGTEYMTV